jgi:ribonuclease R
MAEPLQSRILSHLRSDRYRPQRPRGLAKELQLAGDEVYPAFRESLRELMHQGRVMLGAGGTVMLPGNQPARDVFTGTYRHNRRGFGFVVPTDPSEHEDLYIPEGHNGGAITGDIVRAKITSRGQRDGKTIYSGRVMEIIERTQKRFVGTLVRKGNEWSVMPDGNAFTEPILAPDAASRHLRAGTKVVIEVTSYAENGAWAQGVITEVLGKPGEKDVDLKSTIVMFNLPERFPDPVLAQAREAVDAFDPAAERRNRLDLTRETICTIDPDDAKDYDDAISLHQLENGQWELGVHIADVSWFVPSESAMDVEAAERGNSVYFPGHVIPMLPEILSNGVCSLQEEVPRLCKSAFITYDENAMPVATRFANSVIKSAKRLRYREAQAIIDGAETIPHPDGPKKISDYEQSVVELLHDMDTLARRLQKRRHQQGQIVLDLPEVDLVLDEDGKVVDAVPEDQSFTHTLIEMFMVEANEAVARLLDSQNVPFLRRTHPEPEPQGAERLRQFVTAAGFKLPKQLDRKAIQALLHAVHGKPEAFAISLAVLKSLTRAEYSPETIGHFALASEHYCHFTSPIRRYADLTIHRLLDAYFAAGGGATGKQRGGRKKPKIDPEAVPSFDELKQLGSHLSFTERRADDAERELRQVKILELLRKQVGQEFAGVVTGITNFGIFIQIQTYLIDGLIRYEHLMDDWWDVDDKIGQIRGQRTGQVIRIGDLVKTVIARVDMPRRELDLSITQVTSRPRRKGQPEGEEQPEQRERPKSQKKPHRKSSGKRPVGHHPNGGGNRRHRQGRKRRS